jgi:quinol-cytochrome oxidoreductase complex cytochrome b subunit
MQTKKQETFFPTFVFKEALVALGVFIAVVLLAIYFPSELGDPADPSDTSFLPKPEWYFLPVYQLLKFFPGKSEVIGVLIQPVILLALLLLPFLDRNPERRPSKRKASMVALAVIVVGAVIMGVLGYLS